MQNLRKYLHGEQLKVHAYGILRVVEVEEQLHPPAEPKQVEGVYND